MRLTDFISPEAVVANLKATNKKQLLQELSERAAKLSGLSAREIFDALLHRERLGSTGIGEGIAIPHGKLTKVKSIFGLFARLERPIDFDSLDGAPVDVLRVNHAVASMIRKAGTSGVSANRMMQSSIPALAASPIALSAASTAWAVPQGLVLSAGRSYPPV